MATKSLMDQANAAPDEESTETAPDTESTEGPDNESTETTPDDEAAEGEGSGSFTKPDISKAIPPNMVDVVQRIVAAGMKLMYGPNMRDKLREAVQSKDPTAQVLAENVTGLMLILDRTASKTKGNGIPPEAVLPAAIELLGDAADAMVQAGREVTQDDFKTAMQTTFVLISHKMGMNEAQIMDAANKALPPDQQANGGAPPDGPAAQAAAAQGVDPTIAAQGQQQAQQGGGAQVPLAQQAQAQPDDQEQMP